MQNKMLIDSGHDCNITLPNTTSLSAGNHVTAYALDYCRILIGEDAFVQCRNYCEITTGASSKIDAGNYAKIIAGEDSTITAGPGSVVAAGDNSEVRFIWWLGNSLETTIAKIGQNGLLPNTPYQVIDGRITIVN